MRKWIQFSACHTQKALSGWRNRETHGLLQFFSRKGRWIPVSFSTERYIYSMKVKFKHQYQGRITGSRGFTLLEMVIVLGIIGLILGAAIGLSGGFTGFGREVQTKSKLQRINSALTMYRHRAGHYPSESQGVNALVEKPTSAPEPRSWEATFKSLPKDGWYQEFVYKYPGTKDRSYPEVISKGKDGEIGTDDDLSSQDQE